MVRHSLEKLNEVLIGSSGEVSIDSLDNLELTGSITEEVHILTGTEINADNGTIQIKSLASGTTTFTSSLVIGQSITLRLTDAFTAGATVVYPTMTWVNAVPTLTDDDQLTFWNDGDGLKGSAGALV